MGWYDGEPIGSGEVTLASPRALKMTPALETADLSRHQKGWLSRTHSDSSCLFFAICASGQLVGQIMLHDIDRQQAEAMVGYHVFRSSDRGRGYGTAALRSLCEYAFLSLGFKRLIAITEWENEASRRIAEKCGFRDIGSAREGKHLVVFERLQSHEALVGR